MPTPPAVILASLMFLVLVLIVIAAVLVMVLTSGAVKSDPAVDALAQCLAKIGDTD